MTTRERAADRLRTWSTRRLTWAAFAVLWVVYLATASYGVAQSTDPAAAALAARQLVTEQTLYLDGVLAEPRAPWFVEVDGRIVTDRLPGVIAFGLPFAAVAALLAPEAPVAASGLAGATVTAGAMALLFLVLSRATRRSTALAAAAVAALATPTWSVSADALWPHGVDQLLLVLMLLALAAERSALAGGALAVGILTRPPMAVAAAVVGLAQSWWQRSTRPALLIGLIAGAGLAALLGYNRAVFGTWSVSGGYSDRFAANLVGMGPGEYLRNLAFTLGSDRGVLVHSPFLLLLLPGLPAAWRTAPVWVRSSALAGAAYLLVHLRLNRYSGGDTFFGYRYPLEALTLAAPLLVLAYQRWTAQAAGRRRWFWIGVGAAAALQVFGAVAYQRFL